MLWPFLELMAHKVLGYKGSPAKFCDLIARNGRSDLMHLQHLAWIAFTIFILWHCIFSFSMDPFPEMATALKECFDIFVENATKGSFDNPENEYVLQHDEDEDEDDDGYDEGDYNFNHCDRCNEPFLRRCGICREMELVKSIYKN